MSIQTIPVYAGCVEELHQLAEALEWAGDRVASEKLRRIVRKMRATVDVIEVPA